MATTTKALFRGAATTTLTTTLYTVPSATTAVVTNLVLSNTAAATSTATITLDGINVVPTVSIPANTVIVIDLKQVLATTKIIAGGASTSDVKIHISGVEIA